MLLVGGSLVRILGRMGGMAHEPRLVQTAVWHLGVQRGRGGGVGGGRDAGMVAEVRVPPSDEVPVALLEAQLGVVQDVEVGAAQAVAGRPDEEVAVVLAGFPPMREVGGGAAQLEAGRDQWVVENLRGGR